MKKQLKSLMGREVIALRTAKIGFAIRIEGILVKGDVTEYGIQGKGAYVGFNKVKALKVYPEYDIRPILEL